MTVKRSGAKGAFLGPGGSLAIEPTPGSWGGYGERHYQPEGRGYGERYG